MTDENPDPAAVCEGGDLDCGSGLLLIIREAMQPLAANSTLEVRSNDASVGVDLPAWCRLVGHDLLGSRAGTPPSTSYFVRKKSAKDETLASDLDRARQHSWTVRARVTEGMTARVYARNHVFQVGQPASFDTADESLAAVEYLLGALAACLAVAMRWRASQRGIEVFELEVVVRSRLADPLVYLGIQDSGDPGLEGVEGRLYIEADADDATLEDLWRETLARSPVARSFTKPVPLTIKRKTN